MKTISNSKSSLDELKIVKYLLIGTAVAFLTIMLVAPLITIFIETFRKGTEAYFMSFDNAYVLQAIKLTFYKDGVQEEKEWSQYENYK